MRLNDWKRQAEEYRDVDRAILEKIENEARECQSCGRIMSEREYLEQRLCNDCSSH